MSSPNLSNLKNTNTTAKLIKNISRALLIIIIVTVSVYLTKKYYDAQKYNTGYTIDISDVNFKNTKKPLYLNEPLNSDKFGYYNNNLGSYSRQLYGSPMSFIFKPKEFIGDKKLRISATLKDQEKWQISLICRTCSEDKKYNWKLFYCPELKDYSKVAIISDDVNVYSLKPINNPINEQSVVNWLRKNIPEGTSVKINLDDFDQNDFSIIPPGLDTKKYTTIHYPLRGKHELLVVLRNQLDLSITKSDRNEYPGQDDVRVSLLDLQNNLILTDIIPDDGNSLDKPSPEDPPINKIIKADKLGNGSAKIYRLVIEEADGSNRFDDYVINELKINTNKIVLKQNLILTKGELYTEIKEERNISLYVWHYPARQTINIRSLDDNTVIPVNIDSSKLSHTQLITIKPGKYTLSFNGDQYIKGEFNDMYFALTPENFFRPYAYNFFKTNNSAITITKCDTENNGDWQTSQYTFNPDDLKRLADLNEIEFSIKNNELKMIYDLKSRLYTYNFTPKAYFKDYILWGIDDINESDTSPETVSEWLKKILPANSTIVTNESGLFNSFDPSIKIINESPYSFLFSVPANFILTYLPYGQSTYLKDVTVSITN